jgi:Flp pilus assembly CpaE family ATPase
MRQARVILVCTPEIPALHLAREKMTFLNKLGLGEQVLVVLNRVTRHPLFSKDHVEDVLDAPVVATFSNDYAAFSDAGSRGTTLDFQSPIGRECIAFVDKLRQKAAPSARGRHPKFLRHFTLAKGGTEVPEIESHLT